MLGIVALATVAAGCGGGSGHSSAVAPAPPAKHGFLGTRVLGSAVATDFALRDQDGQVVRLSAERGKLVLLTFLYTRCPDVCPLIASNLNQALRELTPAERAGVRVIAVSVDPAHDTRAAVRKFVAEHRLLPQFRYLSGSLAELKPIWQANNLLISPQGEARVSHSAYVLLLDRRGRPRYYYPPNVTAADVRHDLQAFLGR